jgi:hypothetical protein
MKVENLGYLLELEFYFMVNVFHLAKKVGGGGGGGGGVKQKPQRCFFIKEMS